MNKQRKVLITITYNEMGIIIDTKAEEVAQPEKRTEERTETHACDLISRQAAIDALDCINGTEEVLRSLPSAQPDTEKICARIKAEAIKRNVEYMKHGDRYMLGFVDGMRLARRIVDGTIDDPVYFTLSGE